MSPSSFASTAHSNSPQGTPREPTFADAVNAHFSRSASSLIPLTPSQDPLPPSLSSLSLPASSPLSSPQPLRTQSSALPTPYPPSAFNPVPPSHLSQLLSDKDLLVLDIRPHNSFSLARLHNALSLSVPSTLLKRPLFSLSKLAQMLPSPSARAQFMQWNSASKILVYDADSSSLSEGCNLLGLMRKFRNEGFHPDKDICWLKGGFHAVWRERGDLVDREPPPHEEEDDTEDLSVKKSISAPSGLPFPGSAGGILRTKHLPKSAFTFSSTASQRTGNTPYLRSLHSETSSQPYSLPVPATPIFPRADPFSLLPPPVSMTVSELPSNAPPPAFTLRLPPARMAVGAVERPSSESAPAATSLKTPTGADRENHRLAQVAAPLILPASSSQAPSYPGNARPRQYSIAPASTMAFNPFFDTIRQNLELARGAQGLDDPTSGSKADDDGIPLRLPRHFRRRVGDLPFKWLRAIARRSGKIRGEQETDDGDEDGGHSPSELSEVVESSELDSVFSLQRSPMRDPESSPERRPSPSTGTSRSTSPTSSSAEDLTRALAMQFYRIELGEQRRLMGVMEHHSKESGVVMAGPAMAGKSYSAVDYPVTTASATVPATTRSVSHSGTIDERKILPSGTGIGKEKKPVSSVSFLAGKTTKKDNTAVPTPVFPFSITAGVEKGTKNRYRNIWPFEHARVRLLRKPRASDDDDYMNASFVQPLGTTKRYIATQGPLPATFNDFWTLCWEQNIRVIVMLTREVENALVKCGKYWAEGTYGPMKLRLIDTNDTPEREQKRKERELALGFFHVPVTKSPSKSSKAARRHHHHLDKGKDKEDEDEEPHTIRRVFELTNSDHPNVPPRIVTQLQYLEWPDLNVPDDPKGVLDLVWEVEDMVENAREVGDRRWGEGPLRYSQRQRHITQSTGSTYSRAASIPIDVPNKPSPKQPDGTPDAAAANEVDPTTGIAKNAAGNPPVLLHCSAGVGRTGGFIAISAILDGVRREMRKGAKAMVTRDSSPSSTSESRAEPMHADSSSSPKRMEIESRGSSRGARMEVDSSPSPPHALSSMDISTEDDGDVSETPPGLTMAVSAGHREVHVPVAGFSGPLKASSELVSEVRRATLLNKMSSDVASPGVVRGSDITSGSIGRGTVSQSTAGSGSGTGSGTTSHFGSGTGSRAGSSGRFSASPVSSHMGSFTNLSMVAAKSTGNSSKMGITTVSDELDQDQSKLIKGTGGAEPAVRPTYVSSDNSQSSLSSRGSEGVFKTVKLDVLPKTIVAPSSPKTSRPHDTTSRLDEWRSEVRDSHPQDASHQSLSTATADSSSRETSDEAPSHGGGDTAALRGIPSGYTHPRPLHRSDSPPLISTYDEPIRRVVEDMREQRMSLCQSLRQYVFVHRAILEGALMVVDEERARDEERRVNEEWKASIQTALDGTESSPSPDAVPRGLIAGSRTHGFDSSNAGKENEDLVRSPSDVLHGGVPPTESQTMVSPGRPKRGASPTELSHEGAKGEVRLNKRPSVKRKPRLSDEDSEQALPF